ncbi:phosphopantetheine-binding protein [Longispora fulva]|uniref:Acyl carrier protein n=1 Tax=Longispora fulva TaxID=619741 RepID=A0A8J7G8K9_9ACTN|nr:acyl carrier protein [Longispora fulva]MBG6134950.1 acyl carrier protein [Longispora fulva]GIG56818.1 phosphopantetheine-binding protein [Longispora fulva]
MTAQPIQDWLVGFVADLLAIAPSEVDPTATMEALGVDSATTLVLAGDLGVLLGRTIPPTELLDHPTLAALADHLARQPA